MSNARIKNVVDLDVLAVACETYDVDPLILRPLDGDMISETFYTTLFRSNCLVTNQPDWANVWIHYKGQPFVQASLLQYLVSYRMHQGFHEACVEHIVFDMHQQLVCKDLVVDARFTRRGGIDIHPVRSLKPMSVIESMAERQYRQ
jgi:7-cyano-7-deazaguanine reductase